MFDRVESVTNVSLDYGELDSIQHDLPSFISNFPNLKTLQTVSLNHPVVIPDEYLSRLPVIMQSSTLKDKLCFLKEMYRLPNAKYTLPCSPIEFHPDLSQIIFGVIVGNFCENESESIGSTLDSLPKIRDESLAAMYIVNGVPDSGFFNLVDSRILEQMKCLYVFGDLSRKKIEFISKLKNTDYIINATKPGNRIKRGSPFSASTVIILETRPKRRKESVHCPVPCFQFVSKKSYGLRAVYSFRFLLY